MRAPPERLKGEFDIGLFLRAQREFWGVGREVEHLFWTGV